LTPANAEALQAAPALEVEGAIVYQRFQCGACHQVNGIGMKLGPPLNGVSGRRARDWVVGHFRDPQKFSPGSTMPPYRFTPRDMERITAYVMSIPQ
jgi:cbb3-type cytochrome oxidase cytochrome c subunit